MKHILWLGQGLCDSNPWADAACINSAPALLECVTCPDCLDKFAQFVKNQAMLLRANQKDFNRQSP